MEIIDATAFETPATVDTQEAPRPSFDPIQPSELKVISLSDNDEILRVKH